MNDEENSDGTPVAAGVAAVATATTVTAITPIADVINRSRMRTSLLDRRERGCHHPNNDNENDTTNDINGDNIVEGVVGEDEHDDSIRTDAIRLQRMANYEGTRGVGLAPATIRNNKTAVKFFDAVNLQFLPYPPIKFMISQWKIYQMLI